MRASETSFQSYKSNGILFSANLNLFSNFRTQSAKTVCVLPYSVTVKSYETFSKMWRVCTKIVFIKKIFRKKKFADNFCGLCANLPTVKIWGQSDKLPLSFSSLPVSASSEKIDSRKPIRRVIFTPGQKVKPQFLCQNLIFFDDFFFTLEISFGSLL